MRRARGGRTESAYFLWNSAGCIKEVECVSFFEWRGLVTCTYLFGRCAIELPLFDSPIQFVEGELNDEVTYLSELRR